MRFRIALFLVLVCGFAPTPEVHAAQTYWLTDYDTAIQVAKDKHLPITFYFFARADEWSRRVDETFTDDAVVLQTQSYVCVRLDGFDPALKPLLKKYQVEYLPDVFCTDELGRTACQTTPPLDAAFFWPILAHMTQFFKSAEKFRPLTDNPWPYKYPPQLYNFPPPQPTPRQTAAAWSPDSPGKNPPTETVATPPADNGPVGINSLLPAPANTPSIVASTVSPLSPVIPTRISPAGRSQEILTRPLHGQAVAAPRQTAPPNSGIFILDDSGVTPQGQASQTLRATAKQTSILAAKPAKHPLPVGASKHPLPKPKVDAPAHQAGG